MIKKNLVRRASNRLLHFLARYGPGAKTLRPFLHRLRGVKIGKGVFIGDEVYLENEYPESVELQDGVVLAIRAMVIAHTKGSGRVIIERDAYVCPGVVILCPSGKTLTIGQGAFLGTGSVVSRSVPPGRIISPPRSVTIGHARVPFARAKTVEEFIAGIQPTPRTRPASAPAGTQTNPPVTGDCSD
jgi:acetyltransferase-like isoleucine patch superfamily enzyme